MLSPFGQPSPVPMMTCRLRPVSDARSIRGRCPQSEKYRCLEEERCSYVGMSISKSVTTKNKLRVTQKLDLGYIVSLKHLIRSCVCIIQQISSGKRNNQFFATLEGVEHCCSWARIRLKFEPSARV